LAHRALIALETDGAVLRGRFTGIDEQEWCDRRLLARIHRYTLNRLRAEIEPISPADFQRFLFAWHGVDPAHRFSGIDGLRSVLATLDGFELPASAWERAVLPARVDHYDPTWLDTLCLAGEAGWARLTRPKDIAIDRKPSLRVALLLREHADAWQTLRFAEPDAARDVETRLTDAGRHLLQFLRAKGASFFHEMARGCALDEPAARNAVASLAVAGLVVSDGFAGVRAVTRTLRHRSQPPDRRQNPIGRWSAINVEVSETPRDAAIDVQARALLARYGIVFRRLLARETNAATWRSLTAVYRRLEARGEIRGGRFVSGMSGEQFALPEAVERMREIRRSGRDGRLISISAVDPLNLTGILTSDERVRSLTSSRLVYRDGVVQAAMEGDFVRPLTDIDPSAAAGIATALAGRPVPAVTSGFVGRTTS
jgi:ATP-dependent Lhr-like helicase